MPSAEKNLKPVLLVDDSWDDALLLKRAFRRAAVPNPIVHLPGGELELEELETILQRRDCWTPALILLDVKMPKVDGFEILKWVKSRVEFTSVPTVMLTSSNLPQDILRAETLGATCFLTKPQTFQELMSLVNRIRADWLTAGE